MSSMPGTLPKPPFLHDKKRHFGRIPAGLSAKMPFISYLQLAPFIRDGF
jgi:hypothetical protein